MKKTLSILLASTMLLGALASCSSDSGTTDTTTPSTTTPDTSTSTPDTNTEAPVGDGVELYVVTSYGGTDGNQKNYVDAYTNFDNNSVHTVLDASETANETWKAKIMNDFQTGSEPDVLFYFAGVDSNVLVEQGKVVSIEEIQAEFPDYASNMKADMLPASPLDGQQYCIPVNGYWEGLYVNKTVLEDAGVEVPGADYTWEQFIADCTAIKEAGYTPIAASLGNQPHYWFEFTTLNNGNVGNHTTLPTSLGDDAAAKWVAGMNDLKELYELGFFPRNTLTASDDEMVQMMADDEAAFLIDGYWKIGWFQENAEVDNFTVTYVPGQGERDATEAIGGLSMGYYITQKAWDDPATRAAAVEFVTAMTTDEVVSKFGATAITALVNPTIAPEGISSLEEAAIEMTAGATAVVEAAQDGVDAEQRAAMFAGVKEVMEGMKTPEELLGSTLGLS